MHLVSLWNTFVPLHCYEVGRLSVSQRMGCTPSTHERKREIVENNETKPLVGFEGRPATTRWGEVVGRFQQLAKITGTDKASSYNVKVEFDFYGGIYLSVGTYEISDWPRHTDLGPFDDEDSAIKALEELAIRAEEIVKAGNKILEEEDE